MSESRPGPRPRTRLRFIAAVSVAFLVSACHGSPQASTPANNTPAGSAPASSAPPPPDNGVSALPATEVLTKAKTALATARSYHIVGKIVRPVGSYNMDLTIGGSSVYGTVDHMGESVELFRIGTYLYVKTSSRVFDEYVKTDIIPMLQGKYARLVLGTRVGGLANLVDISHLVDPTGKATKGEPKVVNGVPTITLIEPDSGSKLYVATTGEPYPIRREVPNGEGGFDFMAYNQPVTINPPPDGQIVDITQYLK
jgi:hypothetical protein